jgi:ammonia channel protein AmtB
MIEAGAVRRKNRSTMLIKNLFNGCISVIAFWLFGYGFGFGSPDFFVGHDEKMYASYGFEMTETDHYLRWDIQFAYCMVVVSIY